MAATIIIPVEDILAKNTGKPDELKRTVYKYARDGIKSNYVKAECCQICGTSEDLELHHPHTFSLLFDNYCRDEGITVTTAEEVYAMREGFYSRYWDELVVDVLTLCNTHHKALHKIYGVQPPLSTASKQKQWVQRLKEKQGGKDSSLDLEPRVPSSGFMQFATTNNPSFARFIGINNGLVEFDNK